MNASPDDKHAALIRHVQGATVTHSGPFATLEVPTLPLEAVRSLYDEFVIPFYMKRLHSFGTAEIDALSRIRSRISDELITTLLSDLNWRSRTAAAYFTLIFDHPHHINHIGRLLLRSDVCYVGAAYCRVMAHFHSDQSIDYLNRYLDYYLDRTDLYFDQADALAALRYVDSTYGSDFEALHSNKISTMISARPDFLNQVSSSRITEDINAALQLRNQ